MVPKNIMNNIMVPENIMKTTFDAKQTIQDAQKQHNKYPIAVVEKEAKQFTLNSTSLAEVLGGGLTVLWEVTCESWKDIHPSQYLTPN